MLTKNSRNNIVKMLVTSLIISLAIFCSCNHSNKKVGDVSVGIEIQDKYTLNEMVTNAIDSNDTITYNKVASYYLLHNLGEEFLFSAFMMANKNNSAEACYHIYTIIAHSTQKEPKEALNIMDRKTKNFALHYLLKSYEMGFESSKFQVDEIFGEGTIPPKSSYYLQEFTKE